MEIKAKVKLTLHPQVSVPGLGQRLLAQQKMVRAQYNAEVNRLVIGPMRQRMADELRTKVRGGQYVADRYISEGGRPHTGGTFQAAFDVARGIQDAFKGSEPATKELRDRVNATIRLREIDILQDWAKAAGLMWDQAKTQQFQRLFDKYGENGAEHETIMLDRMNKVLKRRVLESNETFYDYFQRMALHNEIFPGAPYTFKGMMIGDPLNGAKGSLMAVVEQPLVIGRSASYGEIHNYMTNTMKFTAIPGADYKAEMTEDQKAMHMTYVDRDSGVVISDLHSDNVRIDKAGNVVVFDPKIKLDPSSKKARLLAHADMLATERSEAEAIAVLAKRKELTDIIAKLKRGEYVPEQQYERIRRENEGSAFQSAIDLARGIHESVLEKEPKSDTEAELLADKLQRKEAIGLRGWARESGVLIDPTAFNAAYTGVRGGEHQVIFQPEQGQVLKRKELWYHETQYDTLNRLATHNEIFPEAAYKFEGYMVDRPFKDTARTEKVLMPVYSQPYYQELSTTTAEQVLGLPKDSKQFAALKGINYEKLVSSALISKSPMAMTSVETAKLDAASKYLSGQIGDDITVPEIIDYMAKKDFEPKPIMALYAANARPEDMKAYNLVYVNKMTGVVVGDLVPRNFVRTLTGEIVCIDPIISFTGKSKLDRAQEALHSLEAE